MTAASIDSATRRVTGWLVNAITGSPVWEEGRNALFIVFDEGNGPLTCNYDPDNGVDTASRSLLPAAKCYDPANFNDRLLLSAGPRNVASRCLCGRAERPNSPCPSLSRGVSREESAYP